jgi:hypothetical protein
MEAGGLQVQDWPRQKNEETLSQNQNKNNKGTEGITEVVQHLLSMFKVLGLIHQYLKKNPIIIQTPNTNYKEIKDKYHI